MRYIRLKTSLDEKSIEDRLKYNPEIIEFYLDEKDVNDTKRLIAKIRELRKMGIRVYLHHPMRHNGSCLDILSGNKELRNYYYESSRILAEICLEEDIYCIIHAHYYDSESSYYSGQDHTKKMGQEISNIIEFSKGRFLWEDTTEGLFSFANPYLIEQIIIPLNLPINIDISHTFISFKGNNDQLKRVLEVTEPYARYYHLVDSLGQSHDSLSLGKGNINWTMVKPFVKKKDFIFEIGLDGDHCDCSPMIDSARYFQNIREELE
jgi:sugar phosphate isomerase/epimerase